MRRLVVAVVAWALVPGVAQGHWLPRSFTDHYRYAARPSGEPRTPPPATAAVTVGPGGAVSAESGERGAQVVVYLPPGALRATSPVAFRAQPVPPAAEGVRGGAWKVLGNVYRLSARGASVADRPLNEIRLRLPGATRSAPVLARLDGGAWRPLATHLRSGGIYSARLPALGDYALVERRSGGGSGATTALLALAPIGLVLALTATAGRRRRARA
jgi:hypothetical protein